MRKHTQDLAIYYSITHVNVLKKNRTVSLSLSLWHGPLIFLFLLLLLLLLPRLCLMIYGRV
jgi:hypothetical protein